MEVDHANPAVELPPANIRAFVLLAEHLHFGRTAELLDLSQPALTKQILGLESQLGSPLFQRSRQGTKLTTFGKQFLPEARQFLKAYERLRVFGKRLAQGESGLLRIGFGLPTLDLVPRLIMQIRKIRPHLEVTLRDMSSLEQTQALRAEQIDIAFMRLPVAPEFDVRPVVADRLVLAVPAGSPLTTLEACAQEPFVTISSERTPSFYAHILRQCASAGFHPHVVQQVPEFRTALALVRAGFGVSLVPQWFARTEEPSVEFHTLEGDEAAWMVGAAWRKGDTNPALHLFLQALAEDVG